MSGDPLFACGVVKAREDRLLSRADLLSLVEGLGWEEAEQLLDRTGFNPDAQGAWRRSPKAWAAHVAAEEAREAASLLPSGLAAFPWLRTESHNLAHFLLEARGEGRGYDEPLPGGRIERHEVLDGVFPPPWDADGFLWGAIRDRAIDHPLGTAAACRLAAASYGRGLLAGSGSEALAALGDRMAGGTVVALLARARRQGRPWAVIAPVIDVPEGLAGGALDTIYPLPVEEWGNALGDPWGPLVPAAAGRGELSWEALWHEALAPLIGDAWKETLTAAPVVAWFLLRELQAGIAGLALEAKAAGLGPAAIEAGVPRVFA